MTSSSAALPYSLAWRGTSALKKHCDYMMNLLGPAAPPEAFLFRGNAYYAMGLPYFALADYRMAGRVLHHLSGQHELRCQRAIHHLPKTQVLSYPSTNSHTHIFVDPFLGPGCHLEQLQHNTALGRGVVAAMNLPSQSVIVKASPPWMMYPTQDNCCANCATPLHDDDGVHHEHKHKHRVIACSNPNCHEEYCSRECRAAAQSTYHGAVCYNEAFQSVELDVYAQLQKEEAAGNVSERNAAAAQLLLLRIISTSVASGTVPTSMSEVRGLSGRISISPEVMCDEMLHFYERMTDALKVRATISMEEMLGVLSRITANCFHRYSDDVDVPPHNNNDVPMPRLASVDLHLVRAMLNHSCAANTAEVAATGEFVATRDVRAGEELTINYYPHLKHLPFAERRVELERRGMTDCQCTRCLKKE